MSRLVVVLALTVFCFALSFGAESAPSAPVSVPAKAFGKPLTITETTEIARLNSEPTTYKDKEVLVAGKVTKVCQGVGCWVEVEAADGSQIICKSMDESIHFPKDCAGSIVRVQGKVVLDVAASGRDEMKKEAGMPVHACPNPKVKVAIDGAELVTASAGTKAETKTEIKEIKADSKAEIKAVKEAAKTEASEAKKDAKEEKKSEDNKK